MLFFIRPGWEELRKMLISNFWVGLATHANLDYAIEAARILARARTTLSTLTCGRSDHAQDAFARTRKERPCKQEEMQGRMGHTLGNNKQNHFTMNTRFPINDFLQRPPSLSATHSQQHNYKGSSL